MRKYLLILMACLCMAPSCVPKESDTFHRKVKVTNNSDIPIYIRSKWVEQSAPGTIDFPWLKNSTKGGTINKESKCEPGATNKTAITTHATSSIEGFMEVFHHMKIFFVDATAYDELPLGEPLYDELMLDSRIYSLDDLRAINFHVVYPLE